LLERSAGKEQPPILRDTRPPPTQSLPRQTKTPATVSADMDESSPATRQQSPAAAPERPMKKIRLIQPACRTTPRISPRRRRPPIQKMQARAGRDLSSAGMMFSSSTPPRPRRLTGRRSRLTINDTLVVGAGAGFGSAGAGGQQRNQTNQYPGPQIIKSRLPRTVPLPPSSACPLARRGR
jgi:hypothetical protein